MERSCRGASFGMGKGMKFQACEYKTSADSPWKPGIAKMNCGFGTYDVDWIIDGETGWKIPQGEMYNYQLESFPLSCIDTDYHG